MLAAMRLLWLEDIITAGLRQEKLEDIHLENRLTKSNTMDAERALRKNYIWRVECCLCKDVYEDSFKIFAEQIFKCNSTHAQWKTVAKGRSKTWGGLKCLSACAASWHMHKSTSTGVQRMQTWLTWDWNIQFSDYFISCQFMNLLKNVFSRKKMSSIVCRMRSI